MALVLEPLPIIQSAIILIYFHFHLFYSPNLPQNLQSPLLARAARLLQSTSLSSTTLVLPQTRSSTLLALKSSCMIISRLTERRETSVTRSRSARVRWYLTFTIAQLKVIYRWSTIDLDNANPLLEALSQIPHQKVSQEEHVERLYPVSIYTLPILTSCLIPCIEWLPRQKIPMSSDSSTSGTLWLWYESLSSDYYMQHKRGRRGISFLCSRDLCRVVDSHLYFLGRWIYGYTRPRLECRLSERNSEDENTHTTGQYRGGASNPILTPEWAFRNRDRHLRYSHRDERLLPCLVFLNDLGFISAITLKMLREDGEMPRSHGRRGSSYIIASEMHTAAPWKIMSASDEHNDTRGEKLCTNCAETAASNGEV